MVLSLIGPLDNHHVHRVLLVAAYAGTKLKVVPVTFGRETETASYRRNCHPLGRVPALKSDEGYLFETNAIVRYLARTERLYAADGSDRHPSPRHRVPYMLYGKSTQAAAEVDAWLDFVLTEIDPHTAALLDAERRGGVRPRGGHEDALAEALRGLEQRLAFRRQLLRSAGAAAEETEAELSDEECLLGATPRESAPPRGCHTYNIKTHVDVPSEIHPMRSSTATVVSVDGAAVPLPSPRAGEQSAQPVAQTPRTSTLTPRRSGGASSDMIFLVGDSLTAADLVVALAVNQALLLRQLNAGLRQQFPQLVRFHGNILRLPLAAEVRKALGINIL